ncbi:MAG: CvpA family protein [Gammaproteobacteria bacterium]|nr:CvpA family protein [Gammaproteobacteria bacterium]
MLDYLFISYLIWCTVQGHKRMIGKEIEGLLFSLLLLGMLLGIFVITQLTGLIKTTLETLMFSSGFQISLSSFLISISLIFFSRKKITQLTETRFSEKISHQGGAITGFIRGFVIVFIMTTLLSYLPFGLFNNSIDNSVIARHINFFIPVDEDLSTKRVESQFESNTVSPIETTVNIPIKKEIKKDEPEELIIGY